MATRLFSLSTAIQFRRVEFGSDAAPSFLASYSTTVGHRTLHRYKRDLVETGKAPVGFGRRFLAILVDGYGVVQNCLFLVCG